MEQCVHALKMRALRPLRETTYLRVQVYARHRVCGAGGRYRPTAAVSARVPPSAPALVRRVFTRAGHT